MELRIAVCDDAEEDRTYVSGLVKDWAVQAGHQAEITAFSSAESFLFRYAEDKNWDILLLDIEMGAMDGVSLAKRVRKDNEAVQIVFVTGYSDYIAEGYEVAALHYLMKPVSGEKLFAVLNRALEKRKREERCLNLELGGVHCLRMTGLSIEGVKHYIDLCLKGDSTIPEPSKTQKTANLTRRHIFRRRPTKP